MSMDACELAKFNGFDSDFPLHPENSTKGKITRLSCPHCQSPLSRMRYAPGGSLEVDRCISCSGVWLNAGEIRTIRTLLQKKLVMRRSMRKLDEAVRREQELWEAHTARVAEEEREEHVSGAEWLFMFLTRLPVEVHNPVRRFPKATIALILMNCVVFALEQRLTEDTVVNFSFIPNQPLLLQQTYGLVTSMFLHADLMHVAGNLYFLYTFGDNVEDFLGPLKFTILYFLAGAGANLAHFFLDIHSAIPLVGASGAISGLLAAYALLFSKRKIYLMLLVWPVRISAMWYLAGWIAFQAAHTLIGTDTVVAWDAHVGGFVSGAIITNALARRHSRGP